MICAIWLSHYRIFRHHFVAHTPDVIRDAARLGVDLMLSGHTHGGQVRFPLLGATVVPSRYGHRYAAGEFHVDGTTLYVADSEISAIRALPLNGKGSVRTIVGGRTVYEYV